MDFTSHQIFGAVALLISFVTLTWSATLIYRGLNKPHSFSLLVWFIVTFVTYFNMVAAGAGAGAWRMGYVCAMMLLMFFLSLRNGLGYIRRFDVICLVLALSAIPVWLGLRDPELALLWVSAVELVGMTPTLRKAYVLPYEMNPYVQIGTATSLALQLLALESHTFALVFSTSLFCFMFYLIAAILLLRRRLLQP